MTATGMEVVVQPPALTPRDRGTLLTAAATIPLVDRLASGVKFRTDGTQDLMREGIVMCTASPATRTHADSNSDIAVFSSFAIYADESCSVLAVDEDNLRTWSNIRMSAFESAQVANELVTGSVTANPCLRGTGTATTVVNGTSAKTTLALAIAEDELADRLHGAVGMLHVTPGVLYAMNSGGGLELEEAHDTEPGEDFAYDRWYTPSGHLVVADAGYDGYSPTGTAPATGQSYIYGSGPVEYAMTDPVPMGVGNNILSITHDDRMFVLERQCVVRFDPAPVFAVLADLT